jgi:hypothetical protein
VEDHADQLVGRDLHACRADDASLLIFLERFLEISVAGIR